MLHKFGSNLKILVNGNSVNMGNSARGRHLIADELLTRFGRRRGRPWLRAGTVEAVAWLLASEPRYKACVTVVFAFSLPLLFPSPLSNSVELLPSP